MYHIGDKFFASTVPFTGIIVELDEIMLRTLGRSFICRSARPLTP